MARLSAQQRLGKNVHRLRLERGLTQEALGDLSGLDRGYISGVERGVRNPAIKNIERLAKALKVRASDLMHL